MFSNLSTVCLWAGFGVSHGIFQLWLKREAAVWISQFPGEEQPITGSDFDDTPARELALFQWKEITKNSWTHLN